jgi:hypothetical protein
MIKRKRPSDANQLAHSVLQDVISIAEPKPAKNPFAVALGKLGASKGGKARAAALSKKRRKEIAQAAASVRWSKNLPDSD